MYVVRQRVGDGRACAHRKNVWRGVEIQFHLFLTEPVYLHRKSALRPIFKCNRLLYLTIILMAETLCLFCPTSYVVFSCFEYKLNQLSVAQYPLTHTQLINVT